MIGGLGIEQICNGEPVIFVADNQGSIKLAENDSTSKRSKHIDIRYHYTKYAILEEEFALKILQVCGNGCRHNEKSLGKVKMDEFVKLAGLVRTSG